MADEINEASVDVMDSILLSTKKNIGIVAEAKEFDADLIMAINSVLGILTQIGVGDENYSITDENDLWSDYLDDASDLEMIKTYIALKVGLLFDPPQSTALAEIKKQMVSELEWRINVTVDPRKNEE